GTALERGERAIVEDVEHSPIFIGTEALDIQRRAGVRAVQSTPLMSRAGKILGMFSTHYREPHRPDDNALRLLDLLARHATDIIERAQAEQEIRKRTAELEAAYKEAESFSYSISHDLRAPLRAIDGFSMMLLKKHGDQFDEESRRKFDVIRSNAQMMGKLIDDILSLSRLGRKQMSIELLDMDAIVREVWKELQVETANRNINLVTSGVPPVYGDRTLVKQVYANLLGNAIKFTKFRDPALIEVGGEVHKDENVYYVKDNGAGFDMAYYDKLFGIFQRLHKPDEFEGTGVGLATIQRVIQRHGGSVWAEGKVDEGATFYFSLPLPHTHTHTHKNDMTRWPPKYCHFEQSEKSR
ncbi:MAG TPA: ATP-binding protein, partial [Syntrophales bacterium]|nr:ATP-binding protein [Syntrophales bacterium]